MTRKKKKSPVVIRDWETGDRLFAPQIEDLPLDENEKKSERKLKILEKKLQRRKI